MKPIKTIIASIFILGFAAHDSYGQCGTNNYVVKSTGLGTTCSSIFDNGNVGISYTSPSEKLTVGGGVLVDANSANIGSTANCLLFGPNGSGEAIGSCRNNAYPNFRGMDLYTNYNTRLSITNGGLVGIATTGPVNLFDVNGAAAIGNGFAGTSTAPTNGLIVKGNTGIGVAAPNSVLHVGSSSGADLIVGYTSSTKNYYTTNAGSVRTDSREVVDMRNIGGEAGILIKGGSTSGGSTLYYPTLGLSANNSAGKDIIGATVIGAITNASAGSESMDLYFETQTGGTALSEKMRITGAGKVGIGTSSPTHLLQLSVDDAAKPGTSTWTIVSDRRLKTDINPYKDGLAAVRQIAPVTFRYNGIGGLPTDKEYVGVLAQDIQKIAPYMIGEESLADKDGKANNYLSYNANALQYMLVNSVKELASKTDRIETLEAELANSKNTIASMQRQLDDICNGGCTGFKNPMSDASTQPGNQLMQNVPNPFSAETSISYTISSGTRAYLNINALDGKQIRHIDLSTKGTGTITISSSDLTTGTYTYSLYVDDKIIDTKLMVISASK